MTDPTFFRDLAYVFLAAALGGALAWLARQPLILGYVFGGILISPLTPGPAVSDAIALEIEAEDAGARRPDRGERHQRRPRCATGRRQDCHFLARLTWGSPGDRAPAPAAALEDEPGERLR